MEVMTLVECS